MQSAPPKAIFYSIKKELDDDIIEKIMDDQREKKESRMKAFAYFADGIENGENVESMIKEALNIS